MKTMFEIHNKVVEAITLFNESNLTLQNEVLLTKEEQIDQVCMHLDVVRGMLKLLNEANTALNERIYKISLLD